MDFEVIVIGAGVNGSSAAFHSAKSGRKTALVEQFPVPHSRGSSSGQSRVVRLLNHSNIAESLFMEDAYKQWRDIEKRTDQKLLRPASMICVEKSSERKKIEEMTYSLQRFGFTPKITDAATFNHTKGTNFDNDCTIIEDPTAGTLMADKCLLALQSLYKQHGGVLLDEFGIDSISVSHPDGAISVSGPKGLLKCKKLIICAGPWTNKLLIPLGIDLPLRPIKTAVHYWHIVEPFEFSKHTFVDLAEKNMRVYGLPSIEYPRLLKICLHDGLDIDPDKRDLPNMEEVKEKMSRYISKRFPYLSPTPAIVESCIYTVTPDSAMILDSHPVHKNIVFGCGFSGTGFKTGPAVGRTLCELVEGKVTTLDIGAFKANRFSMRFFKI